MSISDDINEVGKKREDNVLKEIHMKYAHLSMRESSW
jgi:hypothetical protein